MLMAACSSPARGEEGGPGTRATWTHSNARDNPIVHLAFSPDVRIRASAGYDSIRLSDPGTGRELATLKSAKTSPPGDLAFSPDGKTLA
jgi:WD40 repeat protein